jgi:formylglycine-generating enzyme required for sulfatase activity
MRKVANIDISNDGCGTYVIKLLGPDAPFFMVIKNELYFLLEEPNICKTSYSVTVSMQDRIGRFTPKNVVYNLSTPFCFCTTTTTTTTTTVMPTIGGNSANYAGQAKWSGTTTGNVTTVGSNGGPSAYGTYDQSGNTSDWTEAVIGSSRGIRGGGWGGNAPGVSSASRFTSVPSNFNNFIGFRLASSLNPLNLSYFVNVGDSGNSNDSNGYGAVSYSYSISQYPVTNCEYVEFLNAVASTDTYGLYSVSMNNDVMGGITRSGSSGSYTYSVKTNMANKPVVFVNWFDCARYCNWLHNGKPIGLQNSSTTETGAYTLNGATSGVNITRNVNANYYIPTENEWYKAAYYKGGGTNAGYWLYATQSNTAPTPVTASSTGDGLLNGQPARVTDYLCPGTTTTTTTTTFSPFIYPSNIVSTNAIYSQSSVWLQNQPATALTMNNKTHLEEFETGTDNNGLQWIQMDLRSNYSIKNIVIGCDFNNVLRTGWGKVYTENLPIQYYDGTNWITIGNTGTFLEPMKVFLVNINTRYIRITNRGNGWIAATEFAAGV